MLGISKSKIYYRLRDYGSHHLVRRDEAEPEAEAVMDALPPREPAADRR
jgi:hypothetical protein